MKKLKKEFKDSKFLVTLLGLIVILFIAVFLQQYLYLRWAHSTFENYYTFRGCKQLLTKTDTFATCQLKDGSIIKIVQYQGKWYLDGDLPTTFPSW